MALGTVATAFSDTLAKQNRQLLAFERSTYVAWKLTDPYMHLVLTKFTSHDSPLQTYRQSVSKCEIYRCGTTEVVFKNRIDDKTYPDIIVLRRCSESKEDRGDYDRELHRGDSESKA
jgi:hypothetical protein